MGCLFGTSIIKFLFYRYIYHSKDWCAVFNKGDVYGELSVALDEFLGAVQRIHNPEAVPVAALLVGQMCALLAQHGDAGGLQEGHNAGVCGLVCPC